MNSQNIFSQLITQIGRVNHLEQEREQQLLELNLLRMKLENATEKANTENHETSTSKSDNSPAVIDEQQFAQAFYAERLQAARRELDDSHTCVIYWQREVCVSSKKILMFHRNLCFQNLSSVRRTVAIG